MSVVFVASTSYNHFGQRLGELFLQLLHSLEYNCANESSLILGDHGFFVVIPLLGLRLIVSVFLYQVQDCYNTGESHQTPAYHHTTHCTTTARMPELFVVYMSGRQSENGP